jgi:hypothetical protein
MPFRHVFSDGSITVAGKAPGMDSDPLTLAVDLYNMGTIDNPYFFSNVAVRDRVIMPVFANQYMIMLLHLSFSIVAYAIS